MPSRASLRAAALVIALLAAAGALAAASISFFVPDPAAAHYDLAAPVPADALYFKDYDSTPYTDGIYYQFDSDGGPDFYCHFILADMGRIMKKGLLDYKLRYPDGTFRVFGGRFDLDQTFFARDRFEWRIGPNWAKGDAHSHRLHLESGPLRVDVTLTVAVPFYRPGDGKFHLEPERKQWGEYTYFPLFTAAGVIRDGDQEIKIKGWGYGNRCRSNFVLSDATTLHTALRWQQNGTGFDFHDYAASPAYGGATSGVLMVYASGRLVHVSQRYTKENLEFITESKTGKRVPTAFRIVSRGPGADVVIEYTGLKPAQYNDPLIWFGAVEKSLIGLVAAPPLDLRFDGRVKLTLTTPAGTITEEAPGHSLALVSP